MKLLKDFTPDELSAFQAYSRLTVVAHARASIFHTDSYTNKSSNMSFHDFQKMLEEKQMIDETLSRDVDDWVTETSKAQIRANNNPGMEAKTMDYIAEAYRLGSVNRYGHLINPNE